ncbi:prepilin-type N-terminal cleavage/methylation domain-containing protein [Bacillus sp. RG28]|uniref:Prepilin-type N-terminal cleavage/methylation domain-containing protein n=1 Tax=Gottfriedia endophytica TaxID=2820819 RepID=A0A940NJP5_9BACI|nr:prepilin-type N-terminal cleavage/methylation domain-containing protein [Gottfriedia endophytica]MBP0725412.1 prepilin-type N-terminal cleavage/methylation domain-containing protein [Gottfriedia endophytica]
MKLLIKRISNQNGLTIIELLAALSLLSMVLLSMNGLFNLGLKTYNKVTVEASLRDEADYVVAMVLNQLYSTHYDDIKPSNDGSLTFSAFKQPIINQYDDFANTNEDISNLAQIGTLKIENGTIQYTTLSDKNEQQAQKYQTDSSIHLTEKSSISMTCTKQESTILISNGTKTSVATCKSGILDLNLVFESNHSDIKPYTVKTEIGF